MREILDILDTLFWWTGVVMWTSAAVLTVPLGLLAVGLAGMVRDRRGARHVPTPPPRAGNNESILVALED
jgi:hypothetical protein